VRDVLPPAAQRGRLDIRPRVVDEVGRRAAAEVDGVLRGPVGRLHRHSLPSVSSRVHGQRVRLGIEVAIAWGRPLAEVAAAVQAAVADKVAQLTGLQVDAVDVTVDSVVVPRKQTAARVT
jgi:uncharacterized alkaline shock family protein YloU